MSHYIVTGLLHGANLRAAPSAAAGLVGNLKFADLLEETGAPSGGWRQVRVLDGVLAGRSGFVSQINLAAPRSDAVAKLVKSAAHYWELFDRGRGRDTVAPYKQHVLDIWDGLGMRPPGNDTRHKDWPWSAAAISAFVRRTGAFDGFRYSRAHWGYIKHAISQRDGQHASGPFWGYDLDAHAPEVGDLVVQWRVVPQTLASARASNAFFKSHTDVVVRVEAGRCYAIGGNVSVNGRPSPGTGNTVGYKIYPLDPGTGRLKRERNVFMLMKAVV